MIGRKNIYATSLDLNFGRVGSVMRAKFQFVQGLNELNFNSNIVSPGTVTAQ